MNEHLRRAVEALEAGAQDVRTLSARSTGHVRGRLRTTVEEILQHLEEEEQAGLTESDDVMSRLDRQSKEIAEELRRVERLMKRRAGQE